MTPRAHEVDFLYRWALDRGAYGYRLNFTPDPETAELFALATALLQAERERRERQWAALERLLAFVPPGGGYEEVAYLPRPLVGAALRAAYTCGWLGDAPDNPHEENP